MDTHSSIPFTAQPLNRSALYSSNVLRYIYLGLQWLLIEQHLVGILHEPHCEGLDPVIEGSREEEDLDVACLFPDRRDHPHGIARKPIRLPKQRNFFNQVIFR